MRILFYCDTVFSYDGVQRVLAELAKALCVDHEVTVLTIDWREDMFMYDYTESSVHFDYLSYSTCPLIERLLCKSYSFLYKKWLSHTRYTSELYAKSFFSPVYKEMLIQRINTGRYDVIVGVHAFMSLHLSAVKNKVHGKVIGWMHNSYGAFFEKVDPCLQRLNCFFQCQMKKLDRVVVLSRADADRFSQKMHLKTKIIYNPLTVKPEGSRSFKYKKILTVGRFSFRHKGFDIIIKASSIFVKSHLDWVLEIVGEGPEESLYRSLIKSYKLEQNIRLCPFTGDIQGYYAHSSVYVLSLGRLRIGLNRGHDSWTSRYCFGFAYNSRVVER